MLLFDGDRVVAANDSAVAELGRAWDLLDGEGFLGLLFDDDAAALRLALDGVRSGTADLDRGDDVVLVVRIETEPLADVVKLRLRAVGDGLVAAALRDVSQEHRLDAVIGHLADSTFLVDEAGTLIWRPLGNAARLGIDDEDALGATALEWIHPEDMPDVLRLFVEVLESPGSMRTARVRARQPYVDDGWILSKLTGVHALDDPLLGGVIVRSEELIDVEVLDSVGHTSGQFQSLAEAAPIGILVTDRTGRVLYRNEVARQLLGPDELGDDWTNLARVTHQGGLRQLVGDALERQERGSLLAPFDRPESTTWLHITAVPQTDEAGRPFGMIATLQDLTAETTAREELRLAQDRLWHLANHDQLTGLPNRSLLVDRLDQSLHRHDREGHGVAVLYGDLDGFKAVNDELGHRSGDEVLVTVARRIEASVRITDTASRFGGDEFLVLCEGFEAVTELETVAQRIIEAVARPVEVAGRSMTVGMSLGIALAGEHTSSSTLLAQADDAMYEAKARGKGTYQVAPR
jgi:diguanylate cyclase (GGDEF)-like protein/PAS domain S-box-containing protein